MVYRLQMNPGEEGGKMGRWGLCSGMVMDMGMGGVSNGQMGLEKTRGRMDE